MERIDASSTLEPADPTVGGSGGSAQLRDWQMARTIVQMHEARVPASGDYGRLQGMASNVRDKRPVNSNAFGRQRDAMLLWLLARHPATAAMLVSVGLFRTKTRASRRLHRLVGKQQLRIAGTACLKDGRPEQVYCTGQLKADTLLHEVLISQLCFKTFVDEVHRGEGEVDSYLRPDAELIINTQRFLLEIDRGTSSYDAIVQTRYAKYRTCRDFVLWVCPTQARMEGLRSRAGMIREIALFTTVDRALSNPHAPIWVDVDGAAATLPRGGQEVARKGA